MREKYIDEAVGIYMIFGEHADGNVDVANQYNDVFIHVSLEQAKRIVEAQREFREKLYDIFRTVK